MTSVTRRVALVDQAGSYVGPALALRLARAGHDLVVVSPRAGLVDELAAAGAVVEVVDDLPATGPGSLTTAEGWAALVDRAVDRFGRIDAASVFPASAGVRGIGRGPFLELDIEDMRGMYGFFDSTFHALRALVPAMRDQGGGGQIVVLTSDAGARPEAGWALYGSMRAGQNFLVQAIALEHASDGISLNVIGSKNAVFAGFPGSAPGAITDDRVELGEWSAPLVAETPMGRLGTMEELAAFAQVLLDGTNRFQTAQVFSYSGGWNIARGG